MSTEVDTCLRRGRVVNRGGDSSTEGEIRLGGGRLVYGGGYLSKEGESRLRRGRLVYEGDTCLQMARLVSMLILRMTMQNDRNGVSTICAECICEHIQNSYTVHIANL